MDALGKTAGGPMYTIENGLGRNWRWMAVAFASFAVICSFATGNSIQSFTVSDQLYSELSNLVGETHFMTTKHEIWSGFGVSIFQFLIGILMSGTVAMVIIGGIDRIGNFTGYLAPFMALIYVVSAGLIILVNIDKIGASFSNCVDMIMDRTGAKPCPIQLDPVPLNWTQLDSNIGAGSRWSDV